MEVKKPMEEYRMREENKGNISLVGNKAPDFTMQACKGDGSGFKEVKLSDYKGKWFVLFFYPLDFTLI